MNHESVMKYISSLPQKHSEKRMGQYLLKCYPFLDCHYAYILQLHELEYAMSHAARQNAFPMPDFQSTLELLWNPTSIDDTSSQVSDKSISIERIPRTNAQVILQYSMQWLHDILGTAGSRIKYPHSVIDAVRQQLLARGIKSYDTINIKIIRECLKSAKLSKYNSASSYIIMELKQQVPLQLVGDEYDLLVDLMKRAIHQYSMLDHDSVKTNAYSPYLILKCGQLVLNESQLNKLIKLIHLQSDQVVKSNKTWFLICEKLKVNFIPTDILAIKKIANK